MDKFEALTELMQDKAKTEEIFTESTEETLTNLKAAGLEFTAEEMEEFAEKCFVSAPEGELTEDVLDDVTGGGGVFSYLRSWLRSISRRSNGTGSGGGFSAGGGSGGGGGGGR